MSENCEYVVNKSCFTDDGKRVAICGMSFYYDSETNCWNLEEDLTRSLTKDDFASNYNGFVNKFCKSVDIVVVKKVKYVVSFENGIKLLPA